MACVRCIVSTAVLLVGTLATPALAKELPPAPGLSSPASSSSYISRDSGRTYGNRVAMRSQPAAPDVYDAGRSSQVPLATRKMEDGAAALEAGDMVTACRAFTTAHDIYVDVQAKRGMDRSALLMAQACAPQAGR